MAFIGVLLFLIADVRLQKKPEVLAAVVPILLVPVAEWGPIAAPLPATLELK